MTDQQSGENTINLQFPWKLHLLLQDAKGHAFDPIISWMPTGVAFKVHDKRRFADEVLPKYFTSSKFKSFQRNLNLWGFRTQTKDPNRGTIFHPLFLRGQPERCHLMKRTKTKKISHAQSISKEARISTPKADRTLSVQSGLPSGAPCSSALTLLSALTGANPTSPGIQQFMPHSLMAGLVLPRSNSLLPQASTADALLASFLLRSHQSNNPVTRTLDSSILAQQQASMVRHHLLQASTNAKAIEQLRASMIAKAYLAEIRYSTASRPGATMNMFAPSTATGIAGSLHPGF